MTPETQELFHEARGIVRMMEGGPKDTKVMVSIVVLQRSDENRAALTYVTSHSPCTPSELFVLTGGLAGELRGVLLNAGGAVAIGPEQDLSSD